MTFFTAKTALICLAIAVPACAQTPSAAVATSTDALRLVSTFTFPKLGPGNFDHFAIDLKRNHLFATPEEAKMVLVLDANSGAVVHEIPVDRPHAMFYRDDIDRLYVTDGLDGSVRVFDGESYKQVTRIPLLKDADAIGYDISKKTLYVANGGKDVNQKFSHVDVIDTTSNQKTQDIEIEGETLEAMTVDTYRPRLYINNTAHNAITVINRYTHAKTEEWPLKTCKDNVAVAVDEQRQRLFVGCRSNQIVVMDSNTGAELQTLTIHGGVDDVIYDAPSRRLYASTDGYIDVFSQKDLNHYVSLGSVPSAEKARTAKLVPELNRLFVAVPKNVSSPARVLAFEPINTPPPPAPKVEAKESVSAPFALKIVQEELTQHPTLRRMGLHAIPPGQQAMVIIANVNESRLGVHTSASDFAGTKDGKITGPRIADGEFFNMKMPMFDAQGKTIGILVMEIPYTDAANEEEAAREADAIRSEIAKKIPSVDILFSTKSN
jgi:DNA-binding beta-propeller fold protein YncE